MDREVFTLYQRKDSLTSVARLTTKNNQTFTLDYYEIDTRKPEAAEQTFLKTDEIEKDKVEALKAKLGGQGFTWTPFKERTVLFVQILPLNIKSEIELLNLRQEIEDKLSLRLQTKGIGEWLGGDIGPGGGNILYFVNNVDEALPEVLSVLRENKLDTSGTIARRIMTAKDDWFYEVIYPTKYKGRFNSM